MSCYCCDPDPIDLFGAGINYLSVVKLRMLKSYNGVRHYQLGGTIDCTDIAFTVGTYDEVRALIEEARIHFDDLLTELDRLDGRR